MDRYLDHRRDIRLHMSSNAGPIFARRDYDATVDEIAFKLEELAREHALESNEVTIARQKIADTLRRLLRLHD